MKNKLSDLRDHLFETLEQLKDEKKPMDISRAHAVVDVAGKIIDSAKVEVEFLKTIGGTSGSQFFPDQPQLTGPARPALVRGRD